jgi:quaternary ammonium compound-resistance protein SugE
MAWIFLLAAAACEIAWAIGLKYTDGFTRLWPTLFTVTTLIISFVLLSQAVRNLPIGTAYAMWTGIGAAGTAVLGMIIFNEPHDVWRIVCLLFIVGGTLGLKFAGTH